MRNESYTILNLSGEVQAYAQRLLDAKARVKELERENEELKTEIRLLNLAMEGRAR